MINSRFSFTLLNTAIMPGFPARFSTYAGLPCGPIQVPIGRPRNDRIEKAFGDGAYGGVFAKALADWGIDRSGDPV